MTPEEEEAWQNGVNKVVAAWVASGSFVADEYELKPPTPKERLAQIPYRLGYYLSYPFLWLAYQIWDGIEDAYLDIWE